MKVLVSGGTGFIGTALRARLEAAGHVMVVLTRHPGASPRPAVGWDPASGRLDPDALEGVDAVVHLAGESLFGRWTEARKRRMWQSRVDGGRLLAEAVAAHPDRPRVYVSLSGVNVYGDRGDAILDEDSATGAGFLAELCRAWEASAEPARAAGVRVVHPRLAPVLGPGGILGVMAPVFRAGLGGRVGDGRQWMPWVHLDDAVRVLLAALEEGSGLAGPVNLTSPEPVTNRTFTTTLGRVLHRPTVASLPRPLARLAGGEMADELLLSSVRALPRRLQATGYRFQHPELEEALRAALGR